MGLFKSLGLVTIRCSRCGADLGTYLYGGISTALCVKCQNMDAEIAKTEAEATKTILHSVPGEDFKIAVNAPAPQPAVPEDEVEDDFKKAAKTLFARTKKPTKPVKKKGK
jgi:hypothetical protein